ncbi:MAG: TonB-dependent receptor [Sphingomonas sp.]|nr:TonB-dependent receptor [Sphingomonas sp.]
MILLVTSAVALAASTAGAQQPAPADTAAAQPTRTDGKIEEFEDGESDTIVVTGQRRGAVIGDIPPEDVLGAADVRATGATSINELLEALAPQLGSARGRGGGRPITLLNGQRVSGFRELRDIPTEAIERVDILPEEVALKYGYRADQRVVNIVLRESFRSTAARVETTVPTQGGNIGGETDVTRLLIGSSGRTALNVHAEGNSMLTEDERDVALAGSGDAGADRRETRSLVGSRREVRAGATVNRALPGNVGATFNGELEHNDGRSLIGLDEAGLEPLARRTSTNSAHAGLALNGNQGDWRWSSTANADLRRSQTDTDRSGAELQRATSTTASADADMTANGTLFALPAGEVGTTVRVGVSTLHLDSRRRDADDDISTSLRRTSGRASVNLDLPVSSRRSDFSPVGNLTVNANAEVERLSDFGTLTTLGAGANWSPVERLNLIASWTREEGAPSVQQLGNPVLETPGSRVFDFTRGETVLATTTTGGNRDLAADRRSVMKLGANWQPLEETDLRLRGEYVRTRFGDPISSFPGATAELEAAFPDRFERDESGELVSVDLRPVNFDNARRDTLRVGFDFSKPLKSAAPTPAQIEALRARRQAAGGGAGPRASAPPDAGTGPRGGRGFGGGRNGGRLSFSLTDTINLVDEATIRRGLPKLDYLGGDAAGQGGGRARHEVEAQAGYFNNGLGARLSANYRTSTTVDNGGADSLRFSPLATVDLRLFANLGQRFDLVSKYPVLRGSTVRLEVNNLFNAKPKVRNALGEVPFSYQPDLLEPLGRTIGISFRKLFLPPRSFFQRVRASAHRGRSRMSSGPVAVPVFTSRG